MTWFCPIVHHLLVAAADPVLIKDKDVMADLDISGINGDEISEQFAIEGSVGRRHVEQVERRQLQRVAIGQRERAEDGFVLHCGPE